MGLDEDADFTADRLGSLLRFARALTGDRALAEDLVQDVVVRLLVADRARIRDLDAYARRMIVNAFLSWRRRISLLRPVALIDDLPAEVGADVFDRHAESDDLRQRLELLSRKQRAAIVLRYFADQSDAEIAELLGCSRNAVRSLISRGLAVLRVDAQRVGRPVTS